MDRDSGLLYNQTIVLTGSKYYPEKLRRVKVRDLETGKVIVLLSNNFKLPPATIAQFYRCRYQIKLFFKWIKQNLRIKAVYGASENAVKTQIWITVTVYLLGAIMGKRLQTEASLYTILQVLNFSSFERIPMDQLLAKSTYKYKPDHLNN